MSIPFLLTLLISAGLLWALWRLARAQPPTEDWPPHPLAPGAGAELTARRLRLVAFLLLFFLLMAMGFHFYWAALVTGPVRVEEQFAGLKDREDQRQRRRMESQLRGWIYDRHHDPRRALARYRSREGRLLRDYPLGAAAAHLIGYGSFVRGETALEKVVLPRPGSLAPLPWWASWMALIQEAPLPPVGRDLVTTIDFELQRSAYEALEGRQGAIVLLDPVSGAVLALVSSPGFEIDEVEEDVRWAKLQSDERRKPLLNRALHEYYLPGSTFKVLTAAAAIEAGLEGRRFMCRTDGWTPPGSARPIRDDRGEAHGEVDLARALPSSCNQYFAQLGVALGRQRMGTIAERAGFRLFSTPTASLRAGWVQGLWNSEEAILPSVLAPRQSTFVDGRGLSSYDLALESIGQGYLQVTVLQMALLTAAIAHPQGQMMRPRLEVERTPAPLGYPVEPATAQRLRQLMAEVVDRGTARRAFADLRSSGGSAGGKTGTAQRQVTLLDLSGRPLLQRDASGRPRLQKTLRQDAWFIGYAPATSPRLAIAVVLEGGGYGGQAAAPIAAVLFRKAASLGLTRP
jgi:peptidoglycan glycosyltransferase